MKALIHSGQFRTWLREDMPAGWSPGDGEQLVDATFVDTPLPSITDAQVAEESYSFNAESSTVTRTWTVREKTRDERVPLEIATWRFRSALKLSGLYASVVVVLDGLPEPAKTVAFEQFEYSNTTERDHPTIAQLAAVLNLTQQQVDDVFVLGASL